MTRHLTFRVGPYLVCLTIDICKAPREKGIMVGFLAAHEDEVKKWGATKKPGAK
ncbi:MAG: hypothetical protein BWY79_00579 [Actinobacteria bacterium ADurb.Bin444]|nr:MAG: hypothetical protein BWY79_00579 [Actinobacteria bacterium ADurb.Bin444]